jgi:hypothetical protein
MASGLGALREAADAGWLLDAGRWLRRPCIACLEARNAELEDWAGGAQAVCGARLGEARHAHAEVSLSGRKMAAMAMRKKHTSETAHLAHHQPWPLPKWWWWW